MLDVACGLGGNRLWLQGHAQYFVTDLSLRGLRHIHVRDLNLVCADAGALPFADNCFDATLATYAFEHSADPFHLLSEMVRVVRPTGRIILLGPCWDLPFWYPNSLLTRARRPIWRAGYTVKRAMRQMIAVSGGPLPFLVVEEPDAFTQSFVYDSDAVYVAWSYEIIHQMRAWGLRLLSVEVDDKLLGKGRFVRLFKRLLMVFPAYKYAGSTILMVFEKC